MNTETIKNHVMWAIMHRKSHASRKQHLCWLDGHIVCLHRDHTTVAHTVFYHPTQKDIHEGFTGPQWDVIAGRINKYFEETNQCLKPLPR